MLLDVFHTVSLSHGKLGFFTKLQLAKTVAIFHLRSQGLGPAAHRPADDPTITDGGTLGKTPLTLLHANVLCFIPGPGLHAIIME